MEPTQPIIITDLSQLVGMVLDGRYALRAVLGEGAMGMVFRATQLSVQRDVAIKVLKLGTFRDDASLERFKREMAIISGLTHPNVVRLLDSGVDEKLGVFYLSMEFIDGVSLGDMLYDQPCRVRPELALEIAYQVCAGLSEPHREGIVHRDIKPDNILLQIASDDTVRVKVVDFGIARAAASNERLTATGVLVGTPAYMAPELCRGRGGLDQRTDLYALGVMLFELLTGFVPFDADTSLAVMLMQVSEPPPPLSTKLTKPLLAQDALQELLDALLMKEPPARPTDAREVRRMIDAIRDAHGLERVRVDSTQRWRGALAPYLEVTNRAVSSQEFAIRTTMIVAHRSTDELPVQVEAFSDKTREQRRAPYAHEDLPAGAERPVPGVDASARTEVLDDAPPIGPARQRTTEVSPETSSRELSALLAVIAVCIVVLSLIIYSLVGRPDGPIEIGTGASDESATSTDESAPADTNTETPSTQPEATEPSDGSGEEADAAPNDAKPDTSRKTKKASTRKSGRKSTGSRAKSGAKTSTERSGEKTEKKTPEVAPPVEKPDDTPKEDPPKKDPPKKDPPKKDPPKKDPPKKNGSSDSKTSEGEEWLNNEL